MATLKPCPFCGNTKIEAPTNSENYAWCGECFTFGPSSDLDWDADVDVQTARAAERWNTRPGEQQ